MATQLNLAQSGTTLGTRSTVPVRRVFVSHMNGQSRSELPGVSPVVSKTHAWGTIRVIVNDDETLEYLATLYNPSGESFSGAFLRRGGADPADPVATLFSHVTLRSRYIQVRGTLSVARSERLGALTEEIRENPGGFVLTVHSDRVTEPILTGRIQ